MNPNKIAAVGARRIERRKDDIHGRRAWIAKRLWDYDALQREYNALLEKYFKLKELLRHRETK